MDKKGLLLVVSGPSGAGKGTVCQGLIRKNKACFSLSVSLTTRKPRANEEQNKSYFFVNRSEFESLVKNDQVLEWAEVYGNLYGTPRQWVQEKLGKGETVLLEIDIQGALQIKRKFPECILIFIVPPSINELQARLIRRGTDDHAIIKKRLDCVQCELQEIPKYDYIVVNDQLEVAL
ncbi:guanylate kinase, partial [Peptococcaceae bacterium]|nr:guanylate kinase [Peptococcaceae bacterium]